MIDPQTRQLLIRHEGNSRYAYRDSLGKTTIGIGRLLDAPKGLTENEINFLFANDYDDAQGAAQKFLWFHALNMPRRAAVIDMIFQLGAAGFREFKRTMAHMAMGQYQEAADEALDSQWAKQTPERAQEVTEMIRTGTWPGWMKET